MTGALTLGMVFAGEAGAVQKTYLGEDPVGTYGFSDPSNWNPVGVPTADDDIVIDGDVTTRFSINANWAVKSVTFLPDASGECLNIFSSAPVGLSNNYYILTVGGDIDASGCDNSPLITPNIVLSANGIFDNVGLGQASNFGTIDVNGFDLVLRGAKQSSRDVMYGIVGDGNIEVRLADDYRLRFRAKNTFSGPMRIEGSENEYVEFWTDDEDGWFRDAAVSVGESTKVRLMFMTPASTITRVDIDNVLVMDLGSTLKIDCLVSCADLPVINLSAIELAGNVNFEHNGSSSLSEIFNLAGIQDNGYCAYYLPDDRQFMNGPIACGDVSGGGNNGGAVGGGEDEGTDGGIGVPDTGVVERSFAGMVGVAIAPIVGVTAIALATIRLVKRRAVRSVRLGKD